MKNQLDGTQELHPTCFHNLKSTEGNHWLPSVFYIPRTSTTSDFFEFITFFSDIYFSKIEYMGGPLTSGLTDPQPPTMYFLLVSRGWSVEAILKLLILFPISFFGLQVYLIPPTRTMSPPC